MWWLAIECIRGACSWRGHAVKKIKAAVTSLMLRLTPIIIYGINLKWLYLFFIDN